MSSPFPGMDPYLEERENWRSFHHLFADEVMAQLNVVLSPKYYADVEVQTVLEEVDIATTHIIYPDTAVLQVTPEGSAPVAAVTIPAPMQRPVPLPEQVKLRSVHVYVSKTKKLVTSIEILSPVNKQGDGLKTYRRKRQRILLSDVHLIELDLLRRGQRPGWELDDPPIDTDYIVLLNRASGGDVRRSEIWPVALNEPLPEIPVPLLTPDPDVPLDLDSTFGNVYARAAYTRRIDYAQPLPPPALRPQMEAWFSEFRQ